MSRPFPPKVVTANDLRGGHVVYLTDAGQWTPRLAEAELLTDEAEAELRLLKALGQTGVVVGAYLAEMRAGPAGPEPVHFRERFRAQGPSLRRPEAAHV
ncbi:MAG: DUF2849 domain-containing protein [Paenirhodobacter sp.]|uniref:DUF2849 domain-containing protein n=1 Tax=Paenirhodobacter sp. TaxID=1965326 RepID=UPI003D130942